MSKTNCLTSIVLSVCMTVLSFAGFGGASCWVLTDSKGGKGDWSQATRWRDGLVPQEGDDINVDSSITATDADMAILQRGKYIVTRGSSVVLTIDVANDYTVSGEIDGQGKCVKKGAGVITLNKMHHQIDQGVVAEGGGVAVADSCQIDLLSAQGGTVYINSTSAWVATLDIRAPSAAYMPLSGNWMVGGLTGDGSLLRRPESTGGQQIVFVGVPDGRAFEFSGSVSPNLSFTIDNTSGGKKANQHLLKAESESTGDFRFKDGVLGVTKIGNANAAGSFGTSLVWMQCSGLNSTPTLLYLGTTPETTDRRFAFTSNPLGEMTLDAGAFGGVTFTGKFNLDSTAATSMMRMALTGSNTVNACQLTGEFVEPAAAAVYMTKRGSGIWRFPATAANKAKYKGVFAVEAGTLEYESLAEAGSWCSLGFATLLHSPYSGTCDATKAVPYAYLLGNGGTAEDADLATFSYVGSSDVNVATRPVALKGAARLRNATDRGFSLAGVTSAQPGRNDLVLDGAGTDNRLVNVTNGVGTVGLVKEGAGTWTLEGRVDVTGGVAVKEGALNLNPADASRMTWFRFTVKKTYLDNAQAALCHFGLFDEEHNDVALGITFNTAASGHTRTKLRPGQAAFETADCSGGMDGGKSDMNNLFKPYVLDYTARWSRGGKVPDPEDSSTCPSLIIRLPANVTAPVVSYDMITAWYDGVDKPFKWTPTDWTVEGSVDGVTWTPIPLDAKSGWTKAKSGGNYWLSDASPCSGSSTGFSITTTTGEPAKPLSLGALSVASSATLAVTGGATVSEWDVASGAGTVSGISFAAEGTLKVSIPSTAGRTHVVSCDLQGCTGLENLKDWTLLVNGEPTNKWSLQSASDDGLVFSKAGLVLIFR